MNLKIFISFAKPGFRDILFQTYRFSYVCLRYFYYFIIQHQQHLRCIYGITLRVEKKRYCLSK